MSKILYSPGYGAGWYTWNRGPAGLYMLTYAPIIKWLEAEKSRPLQTTDQLADALVAECHRLFNERVYIGGIVDLAIIDVNEPFRIDEYDGYESVILRSEAEQEWWTFDKDGKCIIPETKESYRD